MQKELIRVAVYMTTACNPVREDSASCQEHLWLSASIKDRTECEYESDPGTCAHCITWFCTKACYMFRVFQGCLPKISAEINILGLYHPLPYNISVCARIVSAWRNMRLWNILVNRCSFSKINPEGRNRQMLSHMRKGINSCTAMIPKPTDPLVIHYRC